MDGPVPARHRAVMVCAERLRGAGAGSAAPARARHQGSAVRPRDIGLFGFEAQGRSSERPGRSPCGHRREVRCPARRHAGAHPVAPEVPERSVGGRNGTRPWSRGPAGWGCASARAESSATALACGRRPGCASACAELPGRPYHSRSGWNGMRLSHGTQLLASSGVIMWPIALATHRPSSFSSFSTRRTTRSPTCLPIPSACKSHVP